MTEIPIKIKNYIINSGPRGHMDPHKVPRDTLLSNFGHFYVFGHNGSLNKKNHLKDTS
jgi:hypothetical protein